MAGENQGRCSAFKGRPQGRLTIKLLAGAGRAINQMCPPKTITGPEADEQPRCQQADTFAAKGLACSPRSRCSYFARA